MRIFIPLKYVELKDISLSFQQESEITSTKMRCTTAIVRRIRGRGERLLDKTEIGSPASSSTVQRIIPPVIYEIRLLETLVSDNNPTPAQMKPQFIIKSRQCEIKQKLAALNIRDCEFATNRINVSNSICD